MKNCPTLHNAHGAKVLVLGDDYRMVLPIVRSLGRRGISVHLGWCPKSSPAAASRYVSKVHEIPWYGLDDKRWIPALDELVERHNFELIIPATENTTFALQTNARQLRSRPRTYLLDDEVFRIVSDKQATYQLCSQLNIPFPQTVRITDPGEFDALADKIGLPLIVKPCCSVRADGKVGKNYVRRCYTLEDALDYIRYLHSLGINMMLQKECKGEGVGVELVARRGEILVAMQHRRLHETTGHGSTYRETTKLDGRLLHACQRLMQKLSYTGVAMTEFRVDRESGEWVLIEINGRFWGSLPLAVSAGVDFPMHLYEMLVHGNCNYRQRYRVGVRCRTLSNDIRWFWRRLTGRGKQFDRDQLHNLGWVANYVPLRRVLCSLWRGMSLQDHVDSFASDDIRPVASEIKVLLQDALKQFGP